MDVEEDIVGLSVPFVAGIAAGASLLPATLTPGAPRMTLILIYLYAGMAGLGLTVSTAAACYFRVRKPIILASLFLALGIFCGLTDSIGDLGTMGTRSHVAGACSLIDGIDFPSGTTAPLVKALLTGDRSGLPRALATSFRTAGASHILALSGLHLGVIYMLMLWATTVFGHSPAARRLRWIMIITLSGLYVHATGASPSIVRAFLFILLRETAILTNRPQRPLVILCSALTIQLLANPSVVRSLGFQLSYLAMAGITIVYPRMKAWYPREGGFSLPRKVWDAASLSVSCQLFTGPLVWLRFGSFPQYFLLTNLIAMPLASILIMVSVATVLLSATGICPEIMIKGTDFIANALIYSLEIISTM